ncbi:hypothetical protein ACE1ET_20540 [Saccharicrinis sp. FJH62]|uniref:hypothetical protein n=1 Tax=Saccharicrinis sp. FJH62 TaxID=3344657 RepID=UPI0035D506FD
MQRLIALIFIILIFSVKGFSCDCDEDYSYDPEFYHSDVVLLAKIISVLDKTKDSYKVNVEIQNIFKGDSISEFLVYSTPENFKVIENEDTLIYESDCDIYLRVGEEWLIYADKNNEGKYGLHRCSPTKRLIEVTKSELDFLNYHKNLVITDNSKFYKSNELDNSDLTSLSMRGYSWNIDHLNIDGLNKEKFELKVKIDKKGYIISDSLDDEDYKRAIKEIKEFEPFIPGTKNGEIVNSEYKIMIKQK